MQEIVISVGGEEELMDPYVVSKGWGPITQLGTLKLRFALIALRFGCRGR